MAWVHGDLNGANIILDAQGNVWLIDFFHTGPGTSSRISSSSKTTSSTSSRHSRTTPRWRRP